MKPYGTLWSRIRPYRALWSLAEFYGALRRPTELMEPHGALRSPMPHSLWKNMVRQNEVADFEQFSIERPVRPRYIHVSISVQRPGTGINLQVTALRFM